LFYGSSTVHGLVGFVRWQLQEERYRCCLIMSSGLIALMLSTPQIDFNGAGCVIER
jgi:hypothetical protein